IGSDVWSAIHLFLRIGTPGFAMVFGAGLGFFFFDQLDRGRERLNKRISTNTKVLVGGLFIAAGLQALSFEVTGRGFDAIWPERLFYNIVLFYALMVPT